ncbi:caspase domain-containing protein [Streptomyces sp. NPDC101132]|uniref:caspase family protein n=1 Tax=Streptomyces sp. NPDC101132 TaxID=3366110 RepID=UPI00380D12A1
MAELSDPARSQAVLVGVHEYDTLENLPAVARNLEGLRTALTDRRVWGLPDTACTVILQPRTAREVLDAVRESARRAEDTLLVYYAGHGLTDPYTDELYLTLPDSDREREYTSLRYEYLRRAVLDLQARALRTVLILDCCYSGRALVGSMGASTHIADQAVVEGSCLLTASAETRPALSPPGETYTAFTGELIRTLTDGIPDRPDPLDMDTLYRHLHQQLASRSRPLPQQRNRNTGGRIAIARNRATQEAPAPELRPEPEPELRPEPEPATLPPTPRDTRLDGIGRFEEPNGPAQLQFRRRLADAIAAPPDPDFDPVWFAVPVPRPLMREDGTPNPMAELATGVWYLALGRRGDALVVQTEDGRRGLLLETARLQYGHALADETPDFTPFWFAVPVHRPILSADDRRTPMAELLPGTWYLAVGMHGAALLVQTQDGRRGLLMDSTGIQRG